MPPSASVVSKTIPTYGSTKHSESRIWKELEYLIYSCERMNTSVPSSSLAPASAFSIAYSSVSMPLNSAISAMFVAAGLDSLAVDAWSSRRGETALSGLLFTIIVDILDIERVNMSREIAEDSEADIDKEVGSAARDGVNTERWKEDGNEHQKNGRCSTHCDSLLLEFTIDSAKSHVTLYSSCERLG